MVVRPAAAPVSRAALLVAAAVAVLLTAVSGRYGYHRDELYFLACGRHLAWGYPDQGPLVPLLARLADVVASGSLPVLRLPATLCAAAVTAMAAMLARELGGGRFAQVLSATTVGTGVVTLATGHLLTTAAPDLALQTGVVLSTVHVLRTGRQRLWPVVGSLVGLGLLNKQLPVVMLLGLVVGALLTPPARPHLRSGRLWAGAALAAACWAPYLVWQARNGWPQVDLARQIAREYGAADERVGFALLQLLMFGLAGAALWVTGAVASRPGRVAAAADRPAWQPVLAWAWLVVLLVFVVTAGQGYYTAAAYPPLIAAGAVVAERRLRGPLGRTAVVAAVVATAAVLLPVALPVLPAATTQTGPWGGLAENQFETVGWPELVAQVARARASLPPGDRAATAVLATNYGEAGAIDQLGPALGLPPAASGHNGYAAWGPPRADARAVVAVSEGGPPAGLPGCRSTGRVEAPDGVATEESQQARVYVCPAPAGGWSTVWPRLVHLSS